MAYEKSGGIFVNWNLVLNIVLIVVIILAILLVVLYFLGRKMEKRQAEQKTLMDASAQTVSMLIIDKKKMKLKEANLPKMVYEQTPKYLRFAKVPIVKAKVGPKVMTLIAEEQVFASLPIKTEVKAVVSGLYITSVKGVRGSVLTPPKKKKFLDRFKKDKS